MKYSSFEYALYGELTLMLRGADVGVCLAHLQQQGVPLRFVRVRGAVGYCNISLRDFDVVYRTCRSRRVRFRIVARHGLPFWRKRLWRRKSFAFGAVLFICIIYAMSSMVWQINITGPKDEDGVAEIQDAAKAVGLYVGQAKSRLPDPATLQQQILSHAPDFVWVGVQTTGSVTQIQALPKVEGIKKENLKPHDIVASIPAVIRQISASRGRVVVKENQYVHPGQVLISGNLSGGAKNVPAAGQVLAEVWYTSKVTVPLKVKQEGLTGVSVKRDYLCVGPFKLRVWGFAEPHFTATYERDERTEWKIGAFVLPVQWQNTRMYEVTQATENKSVQVAKQTALRLAKEDVETKTGGESRILGQSVLHPQVAHGTLYETVLTRVEQDIGVAAPTSAP